VKAENNPDYLQATVEAVASSNRHCRSSSGYT